MLKQVHDTPAWQRRRGVLVNVCQNSLLLFKEIHTAEHVKHTRKPLSFTCKVCLFFIWNVAENLTYTFISNGLDCCNALFTDLPKNSTDRLQLFLNLEEENSWLRSGCTILQYLLDQILKLFSLYTTLNGLGSLHITHYALRLSSDVQSRYF